MIEKAYLESRPRLGRYILPHPAIVWIPPRYLTLDLSVQPATDHQPIWTCGLGLAVLRDPKTRIETLVTAFSGQLDSSRLRHLRARLFKPRVHNGRYLPRFDTSRLNRVLKGDRGLDRRENVDVRARCSNGHDQCVLGERIEAIEVGPLLPPATDPLVSPIVVKWRISGRKCVVRICRSSIASPGRMPSCARFPPSNTTSGFTGY